MSLTKIDQAKQQVFGSHIIVMETISLFAGQGKDLLGPGSEIIHWFHFLYPVVESVSTECY